jgi:hypothetical protein
MARRSVQTLAGEFVRAGGVFRQFAVDAPRSDDSSLRNENTDNGDLLIDRHPAWDNVWLVGGGSGHGFKHGPAVGRYVTDLVLHARASEPRFALASHQFGRITSN